MKKKKNFLEIWIEKKFPIVIHVLDFIFKWKLILIVCVIGFNLKYSTQDNIIKNLQKDITRIQIDAIESKSESFNSQKELDNIPYSLWRKKKSGNIFLMKFINKTGKAQFLDNAGISRLYFYNKTDSQIFKNSNDFERWHLEDSIVANYYIDTIMNFSNDFYDASNKIKIKSNYVRWRKIVDRDTMVYGMMNKPFIIKKK